MSNNLSRRSVLSLGAAALASQNPARAAGPSPVLLELFTSQGCSSCPPADKLAAQLATEPNNIAITFNVDYWDYLGWRDTLAKPEFSKRQYDYAKFRGDGSVYTPQVVVNGAAHAVGSNKAAVDGLIASARSSQDIPLALAMDAQEISISIPKTTGDFAATLWLMAISPSVAQKIERGENAGSDIIYTNVVRNLVPAAMWKGEAYQSTWMRKAIMVDKATQLVAVLQQQRAGPVLGLARV